MWACRSRLAAGCARRVPILRTGTPPARDCRSAGGVLIVVAGRRRHWESEAGHGVAMVTAVAREAMRSSRRRLSTDKEAAT